VVLVAATFFRMFSLFKTPVAAIIAVVKFQNYGGFTIEISFFCGLCGVSGFYPPEAIHDR